MHVLTFSGESTGQPVESEPLQLLCSLPDIYLFVEGLEAHLLDVPQYLLHSFLAGANVRFCYG